MAEPDKSTNSPTAPCRVFISYSHDSPEHEQRLRVLADQLRADGIDARIDQYVQDPDEGWVKWMRTQVKEAEKTLLVFTETYQRRFEGDEEERKGLGATFEGVIVTQSLYESGGSNAKFRPVIFQEEDAEFIPVELRRFNRYNVGKQEGYEGLLRWLHRAPRVVAGPLGPRPDLPPNSGAGLFQGEPGGAVPDLGQLVHSPIEHLATFPFPKARDADCYDLLGVAWSEQVDRFRSKGQQPPYIPRVKDAELDAAFSRSFFVLISGPSKAGKTRTAFELLLRNAPESALVIPTRYESIPTRPESIRELIQHLGAMQSRPAALALWLDDLERFLLTRRFEVSDLSALSKLPGIKVVGTIRNEVLQQIDSLRGAQEVIARAVRISLEAEMTEAESAEAGKLYPDIRFSKGLGESFIAGPELKKRFDASTSLVKSVVRAACDWSRTGMLKPITQKDLGALFKIYFEESEPLRDSTAAEFKEALRLAREPVAKFSAMLLPVKLDDGKNRFGVFDYLGEYIEHQGWGILQAVWDLALKRCDFPEQYGVLGWMADKRGLKHVSEKAYLAGRRAKDLLSIFNLAVTRRDSGKIDEAVTLFRECLTEQPDYAEAHYNLAVLIEKTDPSGAEEHYRRSIELKPGLAAAHNDYGLFLYRSGRREEALEQYLAAIAGDPLLKHPYGNIRNLIGKQPLPVEIRSIYEGLLLKHPDSALIHAACGYLLMLSGQADEAETLLRKAIRLRPDGQEAYSFLGSLLAVTGRSGEAEKLLEKALQSDPTDGWAHYNLGCVYGQRGERDLAEQEYRAAILHAPGNSEAWYNLGNLLREREAWAESEECYREAIRQKQDHFSAHHNLGIVMHCQEKVEEAENEFRLVLDAEPNNYRAHAGLGCALRDQGDLAGAERELRTSLKLAPDYAYAQQALAALRQRSS